MTGHLEALWETHTSSEFVEQDLDATMRTMTDDPHVLHVPVATGARGRAGVREFYARFFIGTSPQDFQIEVLSRTVGADRLVDEMIVSFTHDVEIPWMLPGIAPTGAGVVVPTIAIVGFRDGLIDSEHIYWDQASVLAQVDSLGTSGLPVLGAESTAALTGTTTPLNHLIRPS